MRQGASNAAKRVAYVFLSAAVFLREWWLRCKQTFQETLNSWITSSPRIESFINLCVSSFRAGRGRRHRGTVPRSPTVLGVVVVQPSFGQQDDQALCRLLAWAQLKGFQQVLLYDPAGELQLRKDELIESLKWVDPSKKIHVWSGWKQSQSSLPLPPPLSSVSSPEDDSAESTRSAGVMDVALLSAADAEEPLLKASQAETLIETNQQQLEEKTLNLGKGKSSSFGVVSGNKQLEAAVAAPLDIKARLAAASGPLAGIEPDIVVVFGSAFTLAGFPPWAVRTAELFEVGALAAVTSGKMDAVLRRYLGTRQRFGK